MRGDRVFPLIACRSVVQSLSRLQLVVVRVKFKTGWVSAHASDGRQILKALDDNAAAMLRQADRVLKTDMTKTQAESLLMDEDLKQLEEEDVFASTPAADDGLLKDSVAVQPNDQNDMFGLDDEAITLEDVKSLDTSSVSEARDSLFAGDSDDDGGDGLFGEASITASKASTKFTAQVTKGGLFDDDDNNSDDGDGLFE